MYEVIYVTTGQRIKAARKKAGMTQAELAQKLEIPFQSISQWERDIRNPKYETIKRIATALQVNWTDLVPEEEQGSAIAIDIIGRAGLKIRDLDTPNFSEADSKPKAPTINLDSIPTDDLINTLKSRVANDPSIISKLNNDAANMSPLSDDELLKISESDGIPKEFLLSEHGKEKLEEIRKMFSTIDQKGFMEVLEFMRYLYFKHSNNSAPEDK